MHIPELLSLKPEHDISLKPATLWKDGHRLDTGIVNRSTQAPLEGGQYSTQDHYHDSRHHT